MNYQNLGDSGLKISRIIVGCMSYGDKRWANWVLDDEETIFKILKKCYDNGLRAFDTADVYSNGKSEILLAKFIKKYDIPRDKIVILSKVYFPVDDSGEGKNLISANQLPEYELANSLGLSRKHIFDGVKKSVERLGTYIDVLQIHRLDRTTPKHEIMKALNDVVNDGYTRYLGASAMKAVEFAQLQHIAVSNGWTKFISMQNYYNLLSREEEREMIPFCENSVFGKVGLIPYSPIAKGHLARPVNEKSQFNRDIDPAKNYLGLNSLSEQDKKIINRVEDLAKEKGVSMAAISCAWLIQKGCNPIVGINSEERVDDILTAFDITLSESEMEALEEPYIPKAPTV